MSIRTKSAIAVAAVALLSLGASPAAFADVSDPSENASCQAVVTTGQIEAGLLVGGQLADALHFVGPRAFADYQVYLAQGGGC